MKPFLNDLNHCFSNCRRILGDTAWDRILSALETNEPDAFVRHLETTTETTGIPPFFKELAALELKYRTFCRSFENPSESVEKLTVNPNLLLLPVQWHHLPYLLAENARDSHRPEAPKPEKKAGHVLIWRSPKTGHVLCRDAVDDDLLALKLVVEKIDPEVLSTEEQTPVGKIQAIIHRAVDQGLLIAPETKIVRGPSHYSARSDEEPFLKSAVFTLQWHITQTCDLHCRHCYDRSDRIKMNFNEARSVLDDFFTFTQTMNVRGHVTFTGGNPLLYPDFSQLYKATSDLGFSLSILGNPASAGMLSSLQDIQPMTHYQISLEGLETYNDYIRGQGHFKRSLAFLDILRENNIYAMVMLTLNRDNMDQVLSLAEILRDRANSFTFNRLAMVGEGEALHLPHPTDFKAFLKDYTDAMASNPVLHLKDNLFNILKKEDNLPLFGGCTGHGCGAAFNFFSLLPDGEVHACRKFPSLIGSVNEKSFLDIYNSQSAQRYRNGSDACRGCDLFTVCRGCPAVVYGMGIDPFTTRDPFCTYAGASNLSIKSLLDS